MGNVLWISSAYRDGILSEMRYNVAVVLILEFTYIKCISGKYQKSYFL